jgi:hypothetical protein
MAKQVSRHVMHAMDKEYRVIFRRRKRARRDNLSVFIGLLQNVVGSGMFLGMHTWRKPLLALGELGRFNELENLAIWICEWYRPGGLHQQVVRRPLSEREVVFDHLFDDRFQQMLVSWCFRPVKRRTVIPERCLRWARILKRLRDDYRVTVKDHLVMWIFIRRLRLLFTRVRLPVYRPHNRIMRKRNKHPIAHYWALYNVMWGALPQDSRFDKMEVVMRDVDRLEQLREQRRRRRRTIAFQSAIGAADVRRALLAKEMGRDAAQEVASQKDDVNNTVMYRDMFNASWEDYRK